MIFSVGIGFWVLGLPTSLILRGDPEDYGQYPDGEKRNNQQSSDNKLDSRDSGFSVKEALRNGNFGN